MEDGENGVKSLRVQKHAEVESPQEQENVTALRLSMGVVSVMDQLMKQGHVQLTLVKVLFKEPQN